MLAIRALILLPAVLMAQPAKQTYTYKVVGDCSIQADVYRAPGDSVHPAILWIHGGALIMGNRESLRFEQLEKYLKAGYTVVSIDYRLAPETKLNAIIEDVQDAHRWLREKGPGLFGIDPGRVAVIGHSAGGYLTLMAGFCLKPRPKALVAFYGYGDIAGKWYAGPDLFYSQQPAVSKETAYQSVGDRVIAGSAGGNRSAFYLYCRQHGLWPKEVTGRDPDREPKAFDPWCPIRNVTKEYPPTLLLHGDKDTDVPYQQSVLMARKLDEYHVEHDLITMSNRGHGFDREMQDPAVAAAFDRVMAFLKKHLRPN
ncbi:MAG: Carboxylesterase LipF [Bryobacterales bacterium]|nr:Carboxylesterase LipF [Bryobacterales bacterium]